MLIQLTQVSLATRLDPATRKEKFLLAFSALLLSTGEEKSYELELDSMQIFGYKSGRTELTISGSLLPSNTLPSSKTSPGSQSGRG